ncbi:MAG: TonB-dependent receptor [Bacteroidales bacterium]|nr:TonB-dependent receptor [Bacteroidales bacterium]
MRKLTFLLACLFLVGVGLVNAQSRTVTGKVIYAEDEQPVIGAYVVVQGTSRGTVTDADGNFSISVPQETTILEFSFLGLQAIEAEARNGMVVRMEQGVSELDEVMVVAFGTATKKSFTGSAAVINEEMIEKVQSSNVTNNLAGRIAGVQALTSNGQPGTGSSIRIRGIGSMNSSNAPLYVVDGVPYDSDISAISNSDIESVTVLKDASSAALYGSRGANGVVIITTKKGKFSGKDAQVRVETKWGSNSRAVPTYQIMTDPGMYYETFYRALYNSRVNSFGDQAAHEYANKVLLDASNGGLGYQVYSIPEGERLVGTNFKLNPNAIEGYSDGTYTYLADNWFNEVFKKDNLRQEYNLSVNGSSDKLTYFASGNFLDDTGIIENSDYQRFSARLNTDYQAKEWLKFVTNVSYVRTDSRYPDDQVSDRSSGNIFYLSNMLAPIYPLYIRDSNGQIMKDANNYTMYDYGDGTIVNAKRPFMSQSNPASMLMLNTEKFSTDFFVGKWSVVAEIFKGLKATATIGVTSANEKYNMLMNPYYGQFADGGGYVAVSSGRFFSLNQQYLLNYNKKIDLHNIELLAGVESYNFKNSSLSGSKTKVYQDRVPELNNAILDPSTNSSSTNYSILGALGSFKYDYDSKYYASLSFRRDGSSVFAPENRWGNFWSVGAAWDISSEGFMSVDALNMLKLKVSYGAQGNDKLLYSGSSSINFYPYTDQYVVSENNGEFATARSYKGFRDITWETSYNFNVGIDFSAFDQNLNGSVEAFNRKTEDMLYYKPVPGSNGYTEIPQNIGSVSNSGVELDLNYNILKTRSLTWNVYLNATYFKNKIIELSPELEGQWISGSYIYKEGESMYNFYIREYAGVDEATGDAMWYVDVKDNEGNVTGRETTKSWTNATRYEQGDILPKVYGGFGTSLNVYGFDFSVDLAYQLGGRNLDNTYLVMMHSGYSSDAGRNWHTDILNAWTPENTKTDVPRLNSQDMYTNATSTRFLVSTDYLSLQNITLGYTLPSKMLSKLKIEKLRVFGVADNLAILTARKGLDPRQSYSVAYSGSLYTPIRSVSAGINITF